MQRYSDSLPEEIKDTVMRIQAQTVSDFKSCTFEMMEGMSEEFPVYRWVRAQKDEETKMWSVVEYQTAPYLQEETDAPADINALPTEQRIMMHRACFMDALHACAAFETYERSKGKIPACAEKEELGIKHYEAAGKEEGIPFDLNSGDPVPMVNGRIIGTNGQKYALPALSEDFEEKSKDNLLVQADLPSLSAQAILGRPIDMPQTSFSGQNTAIAKNIVSSAQELTTLHRKRLQNLENLSDTFNHAWCHKFKKIDIELENPFIALTQLPALATVPAAFLVHPVIAVPSGIAAFTYTMAIAVEDAPNPVEFFRNNGVRFPMHKFNRQLKALKKNIDTLDDAAQKAEFHQAVDKMKLAAYAIRAKNSFNKAAENGGWMNKRRMYRDLNKLEKTARSIGMPQDDINALFNELQKNYEFKDMIRAQCRNDLHAIENGFDAHITRQQKRLSLK